MSWTGIIGRKFSPAGFDTYVRGFGWDRTPSLWRPSFIVVHNTSEPSRALYAQWQKRTPPVTMAEWMQNLVGYYRDQQGWSAGPHLFVADDGIGVFTPLTGPGVHTPSWNHISWGVETVGEFETEEFSDPVRNNLVSALATLHSVAGLDPANYLLGVRGLHFHHEDPATTHRDCPGRKMLKPDLVIAVTERLAQMHGGEHAPGTLPGPPQDEPLPPQGPTPETAPTVTPVRFLGITATVFGGEGDEQPVAYGDVAKGWPSRPGVALPAKFTGPRPKVMVFNGALSVRCEIVDIGPWNTMDPYWATGQRPQAESGLDHRGRTTNRAGIDLTPAAAAALGIDGKGLVNWEFA